MNKSIASFLLLVLVGFQSTGQINNWYLDQKLLKTTQEDSSNCHREIKRFLVTKTLEGFIYANLDSIVRVDSTLEWHMHQGAREKWKLRQIHLTDSNNIKNGRLRFSRQPRYILEELINNGYPFAQIAISSVSKTKGKIFGSLAITLNDPIVFDSIKATEEIDWILPKFLWKDLDIIPGAYFSQSKYLSLTNRIRQSELYKLNGYPDIEFVNGKATVYLDVKQVKSNSFDGIVGLQQSGNRTTLIGNLDLHITNLFKRGQSLGVDWMRFKRESQQANMSYEAPYVFGSSINLGLDLHILKEDSSFTNQSGSLSLSTRLFDQNRFSIIYRRFSAAASLQEVNQGTVGNFRTDWYGIQVGSKVLPRPEQSIEGLWYTSSLQVGNKKLDESSDTIDSTQTLTVQSSLFLDWRRLLTNRLKLVLTFHGRIIDSDVLFQNELFRLGGLSTLRGFNENQFFAARSLVQKVEGRYFFEESSYFSFFSDLATFYSPFTDEWLPAIGLGSGLTVNTNNGNFTFVLGTGSTRQQTFSLNQTRVHFGYSSTF